MIVAVTGVEGGRVGGVDEGAIDPGPTHLRPHRVDRIGRYAAVVPAPKRDVGVENGHRGPEVEVYLSHIRATSVLSRMARPF